MSDNIGNMEKVLNFILSDKIIRFLTVDILHDEIGIEEYIYVLVTSSSERVCYNARRIIEEVSKK